MTTQEGSNVGVCAIEGNFDDAQTGVKKIFTDKSVAAHARQNYTVLDFAITDLPRRK